MDLKRINGAHFFMILLCLLLFSIKVLSNPKSVTSHQEITFNWIAYMEELLKEQVLSNEDLLGFEKELKNGRAVNPLELKKSINPATWIHFQEFEKYLELKTIEISELLNWVQDTLGQRGQIAQEQAEVQKVTECPFKRMVFYPIPGDSYMMGERSNTVPVELDGFEIMSTLVTQWQWAMVMKKNPSYFTDGDETITLEIQGQPIQMQPDHPVENVSHIDITEEYIPKLNELSARNDPLIKFLIPDHQQGDQFELPTGYQWECVARGAKAFLKRKWWHFWKYIANETAQDRWHFGNEESKLAMHAWYWKNSDEKTHAVAQLTPLYIHGNPFYDLYGNVWEWVRDWHEDKLPSGKILEGFSWSRRRVIHGGGWSSFTLYTRPASRDKNRPEARRSDVGFRLIRRNQI